LTPTVHIRCAADEHMLSLDDIQLSVYLDKQQVTCPTDYMTAITTVVAMYWAFDVKCAKGLQKTLSFLAGHVCKLEPFKPTPAMQKVLNVIYCD